MAPTRAFRGNKMPLFFPIPCASPPLGAPNLTGEGDPHRDACWRSSPYRLIAGGRGKKMLGKSRPEGAAERGTAADTPQGHRRRRWPLRSVWRWIRLPATQPSATPRLPQEARTRIVEVTLNVRDPAGLADLARRCASALDLPCRRLVIDLTAVRHADTRLLASLVLIRRAARQAGVPIELRVSPHVREWLAVYGLTRIAPIAPPAERPPT